MIRGLAWCTVAVLLILASPAQADFSGLASSGFTYCYVHFENTGGNTCIDWDLDQDGSCEADCGVTGSWGDTEGFLFRRIVGRGNAAVGDAIYESGAAVWTQRSTADTLRVYGDCWAYAGSPEIALFRFDGDPSVFDGTAALHVAELVDLGLIDVADVLLVYTCSDDGEFSFDVNVPGIPDEELVLFAASYTFPGFGGGGGVGGDGGGEPVPAISPMGAMALMLLLLGVGTILLRRRT